MQQIYIKYQIEFNNENLENILLWGDLVKVEPFYNSDNELHLIHIYDLKDHLIGSINCFRATLKERRYYYDDRGTIIYLDKEV